MGTLTWPSVGQVSFATRKFEAMVTLTYPSVGQVPFATGKFEAMGTLTCPRIGQVSFATGKFEARDPCLHKTYLKHFYMDSIPLHDLNIYNF